ncbi:MAG: enolase C-terminal domain-like protein [Armatimonas sp.]
MIRTIVLSARVEFIERAFSRPLVLSSGAITHVTEAKAFVRVRVGEQEAEGIGSIYLSDLWGWPDPTRTHTERDSAMRAYTERIAAKFATLCGPPDHPLTLGLRLHQELLWDSSPIPPLARLICAASLDAALHDATGQALQASSLDLYPDFPEIQAVLRPTNHNLTAWWIVGVSDDLDTLGEGYHAFKLKLGAKDPVADAARTATVFAAVPHARLAADPNCAFEHPEAVSAYLDALEHFSPEAYAALEYIEQPTARDIATYAFDWHEISARKPVILDEGLTSFDTLELAHAQGWSGIAIKTCRGHSFALASAARAHAYGMQLVMQDLTNPGYAAIHSALLASRLPVTNGIELNAAQFTPDANAEWLPRLDTLLAPIDGVHRVPAGPLPIGLGSQL